MPRTISNLLSAQLGRIAVIDDEPCQLPTGAIAKKRLPLVLMVTVVIAAACHLITSTTAVAEVTVCDGDGCVVIANGKARQMTQREVDAQRRRESLTHIEQIDCGAALRRGECERAVRSLSDNFRYRP